jgi:hypothetical protein
MQLGIFFINLLNQFLDFYDNTHGNNLKPFLYLILSIHAIPYYLITIFLMTPFALIRELIFNFNLTLINVFLVISDTISDII